MRYRGVAVVFIVVITTIVMAAVPGATIGGQPHATRVGPNLLRNGDGTVGAYSALGGTA